MSFPQNKKTPTSKIIQNPAAEKNADTSLFWTRNPKSCNIHTSNFHILELLNLDFFIFFWGGGIIILPYFLPYFLPKNVAGNTICR